MMLLGHPLKQSVSVAFVLIYLVGWRTPWSNKVDFIRPWAHAHLSITTDNSNIE